MKRIIALLMVTLILSTITGCGGSSGSAKTEKAESSQDAVTSDDGKKEDEEQPEADTVDSTEKTISDNPLMNAEVEVNDVLNGTGNTKIGERASVMISSAELETLTPEQLYEFATGVVDGSGYNWFTVRTDGEVGLQFNGSNIQLVSQGVLDELGRVVEEQGTWKIADGSYELIPVE